MKYLLSILITLTALTSFGQQITYKEWQEQAKNEIRLLPEYGNVQKTTEQQEFDQKLIKDELELFGSSKKASDELIKRGFDYLYKGDIKTAMFRFNQAWLLDPKNENVYWGYGSIYFAFNDKETAFKQYAKGLAINPKSSNILTDKATIYMVLFEDGNDKNNLENAIQLFKESYNIDNTNQNTLFKLSVCYFLSNDCVNALKYYNDCIALGGTPISDEYKKAIKEKCKN